MQCTFIALPCPSASFIPWSVTLWCSPQHKYQALGIREPVHPSPSLLKVDSTVQSFVRESTSGLSSSQTSSWPPNSNSLISVSRLITSSLINMLLSHNSLYFTYFIPISDHTVSVRTRTGQSRLHDNKSQPCICTGVLKNLDTSTWKDYVGGSGFHTDQIYSYLYIPVWLSFWAKTIPTPRSSVVSV